MYVYIKRANNKVRDYKKGVRVFNNYMEHISVNIIVCFGLDYFLLDFNIIESVFFYTAVILGSILPDIDTPKSYLGHKFKILSTILYEAFGHRTLTHSILFITIVFFISALFTGVNSVNAGLMLGSLLHILGDMTTASGVAAIYPVSRKKYKLIK